jgi:membrane protease YdiL (CAAX protease family)
MDEIKQDTLQEKPFNNRYLNSGLFSGYNKFWMYFFTLGLTGLGYMGFQAIIVFPLMAMLSANGYSLESVESDPNLLFDNEALGVDKNVVLVLAFGMFVFAFVGFFLGLRFVHHKTLKSVFTGYTKFRFERFATAFTVWAVLLVIMIFVEYVFFPQDLIFDFNLKGFIVSIVVMLVFMPIQTGLEELVFRGYLVQGLSQLFKSGIIPLLITSLLFGLAHMTNPEVRQFGWPVMLTYYTFFALFLGGLTLLDEGLELAFGIHFANNFMSSVLVSSPHGVIKTYSLFQTKAEDPFAEVITWAILAFVTFMIFFMKYRWRNFNLLIK